MQATARLTRRTVIAWAAAAGCLLLASCAAGQPAHQQAASPHGKVIALTSMSALRSVFDRENGHPRLVLIFSPT
jgi:hypothetical protein